MCLRKHGMHTHCHTVEVQFGAETWAIETAEKKHKEASVAMIRGRGISCLTALRVRGRDETDHNTRMRYFEGLIVVDESLGGNTAIWRTAVQSIHHRMGLFMTSVTCDSQKTPDPDLWGTHCKVDHD
jgi:hypothetical protein